MNVVDAHHHLWDPTQRSYPWMNDAVSPIRRPFTIEDLRATLPPAVRQTIVVQAVSSEEETEELLCTAEESETIAGVVGWVDLTARDVGARIERLRASKGGNRLVGIRHQVHDEEDGNWLLRDDVLRGLQVVADARLVYDLLVRTRELPAAAQIALRVPHLQLVVDHGAKPGIVRGDWNEWSEAIAAVSRHSNVVCKISGLITEADWDAWSERAIMPYVHHLLTWFGSRRLLFGSDWPVCLLAGSYDDVFRLARRAFAVLPESAQAAIFGGNARRIYGLDSGA
ncbi:MAG: amidohydrolase family protein [Vulcanimicrobiaceae bacterium]